MNTPKTPLFYVTCTTCESRLRFYNESRLGQIVPCPKCGSMVLVTRSAPTLETGESEHEETPPPPAPPELPAPPLPNPDIPEIPVPSESSPKAPLESLDDFDLEPPQTHLNPVFITSLMLGIALAIFLLCVGLSLLFRSKDSKIASPDNAQVAISPEDATQILVPEEQNEESEESEAIEDESDAEPMENSAVKEPDEFEEIDSAGLSDLMPGDLGRKLMGETDLKTETDTELSAPTETPELSEHSAETELEETPEPAIEPTPEEVPDSDGLQFSRKKRGTVYSGEENPAVRFATGTKEETSEVTFTPEIPEESSPDEPEDAFEDSTSETAEEETAPTTPELFPATHRVTTSGVEYLDKEFVQKLAIPLESISIENKRISDVLQLISQMSGVRIMPSWTNLKSLGVTPNSTLSLTLKNTTLRETLSIALAELNLGVINGGSSLKVVGLEVVEVAQDAILNQERLTKTTLEVKDLVGNRSTLEVITLIQTFVHPSLWNEYGGPGKISFSKKSSKIQLTQYPSVTREVVVFCDKLRGMRGLPQKREPLEKRAPRRKVQDGSEITNVDRKTCYASSEAIRNTPVTIDFSDGITLRNAFLEIFRMKGVNAQILFEEEAIALIPVSSVVPDADVPGFDGKKRVLPKSILELKFVYNFDGETVEQAINRLLENLPLVCYPIGKDVFVLTTQTEAQNKLLLEFYFVGDIAPSETRAGAVVSAICEHLQPETWSRAGGRGEIFYDGSSKTLIVLQSPLVHAKMEQFLIQYRNRQKLER